MTNEMRETGTSSLAVGWKQLVGDTEPGPQSVI